MTAFHFLQVIRVWGWSSGRKMCILCRMVELLQDYVHELAWVATLSLGLLVISIVVVPLVVTRLPVDYFIRGAPTTFRTAGARRLNRVWHVLKNVLGYLTISVGVCLLFLPGQGILTILIGAGVADFPGKQAVVRRIFSRPLVRRSLNQWRERAGVPPFQYPGD